MNVGKLNRPIKIQRRMTTEPPGQRPVNTWTDVFSVFSVRVPVRGREVTTPTGFNEETIFRYEIRYRPGIEPDMRIFDRRDNKTYNIYAVLDDVHGDRTETHLMAKVVADG